MKFGLVHALISLLSCNLLGCSTNPEFAADGVVPVSQNSCSADAECGAGACVAGSCRSLGNQFTRALFEVAFPSNALDSASALFFLPDQAIPAVPGRLDLETNGLVRVAGVVQPQFSAAQEKLGCKRQFIDPVSGEAYAVAADESVPVRVSLTPVERFLGLNTQTYSTKTSALKAGQPGYEFALMVPPGQYDVYFQPDKPTVADCAVPPINLRRAFTADTLLSVALAPPEALVLTVAYSPPGCDIAGCGSLDGWAVEVVEKESARVISTRALLSDANSVVSGVSRDYSVALNVASGNTAPVLSGSELVRLSPPEGKTAPVLYAEREGLELFGKGQGAIEIPTAVGMSVSVQGLVEGMRLGESGSSGVPASVTFVATELDGFSNGLLAAFSRTVEADPEGRFTADLLPGTYKVRAVPKAESDFAATEVSWSVGEAPTTQTGKSIEVKPKVTIQGLTLDLQGRPARGMPVQVVPSADMQAVPALQRLILPEGVAPRGGTATLNSLGEFVLPTDPGKYDISIRAPEQSGFAWLVRPKLIVLQPGLDLEQMTLPLPVVFEGGVRAGSPQLVPGALIRMYLYLDAEGRYVDVPAQAVSVVQVAECRADSSGNFNLYVPAKLN